MSGLIMTLSDDDDEPMQQAVRRSDNSSAALTAEQKKAQRQQANKLFAATSAASAAPAAPAKTLAQQLADAEREGDGTAVDESDDEEFEMAASAKAKAKATAAPAGKKGGSKAQKRKAAAAELDAAEDDDDDDAAGSFAWDADASLAPAHSSIAPPSKMFEPFVVNAGTSLQHKIEKQMAQKKKKAEAQAAKNKATAAKKKKGSDDDEEESSEDDVDSEGSDSDDDGEEEAEAAADADELDSDVDMHAYKDDEVRRKVPASASGPKIITATTLPKAANPIGDFASLKLSRPLLRAVSDLGWAAPTPVQSASIMPAVAGKDLLVNAVTGSGKTGAFMLPILERLLYRPKRVPLSRVLVLLPTRELAAQCHEVSSYLCKYTDIRICLVVGGLSEKVQEQELRNKPDIILATPGRLIDHLRNSANVHLEDIEILVLDEADRLLECGFAEELREIIRECPKGRQTLLFSATLTEHVVDLVNLSLNEPVRIKIDAYESIVDNLQQEFIRIRDTGASAGGRRGGGEEKTDKESDRDREAIILSLVKRSFKSKTIIFLQSKIQCHRMSIIFGLAQLKAAELQGNMTQTQRLESLEAFREGRVDFLLCTDLAARGLDIAGVETVLSMSMPRELRQYIHRVGRTARAGRSGRAVTLVGEGQRAALKELVKKAKDVVHSRVVAPDVIAKYRAVIRSMESDIRGVFDQEAEEKAARVAEMEANKLSNTMRFSEEIHARPAKTWFQTPAEKARAKEGALRVFGDDDRDMDGEDEDGGDLKSQARRAAAKSETAPAEKPLTPKQLARAEAKLAKEKEKDKLRGLSRTKKRRKMMEQEAKEMAAQARKEALAHAPESLRGQALKPIPLPPSFEQQQNMQRLAGAKAKKAQRAEKAAELGIADVKEKRREQQAMIALRMDKKKGLSSYNNGSMEPASEDGAGSHKKKPTSIKGSIFRYKDRTGSGDDRFKMPHRKFKEDQQQRAKGEASAAAGAAGDKKKSGSTKGSASFKSKSKFKRR